MIKFRILFPLLLLFCFNGKSFSQVADTMLQAPLTIVEQMPNFPGGEEARAKWIVDQIILEGYPQGEKESNISGKCYVTFVVEKDGSISNVKILRGVENGPGYDALAIRVVKRMPNWIPGKQNGREVRVQFNLPIKFTSRNLDSKGNILPPGALTVKELASMHYGAGLIYAMDEESEYAIKEFTVALETFPKDPKILYHRGNMYMKIGKKEEACADWNKSKALGSVEVDLLLKKHCVQ